MNSICATIDKRAQSLQAKIDHLGTPHLTNTWKRQNEQRQRDKMIERYTAQKQVLEYLQEKAFSCGLSSLETALVSGAFYDTMSGFSAHHQYAKENSSDYTFPSYPTPGSDARTRLQKAGITNQEMLLDAILQFDDLYGKATFSSDPNAARLRDLMFSARLRQRGDIQFTSKPLAEQLISLLPLEPCSRVLEPEAGIGGLADEVKAITPHVDCAEIAYDFREILQLKGHSLLGGSLFDLEPHPIYDAVAMNPPFSDECQHIRYAFDFLKPGGALAAVCSVRIQESEKREYEEFRRWFCQYHHQIVKPRQTQFEMTSTRVLLLKIDKSADRAV